MHQQDVHGRHDEHPDPPNVCDPTTKALMCLMHDTLLLQAWQPKHTRPHGKPHYLHKKTEQ